MVQELQLRLPLESRPFELDPDTLFDRVAAELEVERDQLAGARIERISLDARARHQSWLVRLLVWRHDEPAPEWPDLQPPRLRVPSATAPRIVVIGAGPAGLFCAYELLRAGLRVCLLERGKTVQDRRRDIAALNRGQALDPESNYAFGEGGAGTFSDGKLYARSGSKEEVREVLETLVRHGAPEEILIHWRPHIGSNRLPKVIEAFRGTLLQAGAELRFETRAQRLEVEGAQLRAVHTEGGERLRADAVVVATGHSAPDSLLMLQAAGVRLEAKGFAMGVRIEHAQDWLDEWQFRGHKQRAELPPAFYELSAQAKGRGVYSFCMCPGGWIVPSQTQPQTLVVNGMSLSKRDSPYANSGVVVAIEPQDWCGGRGWRWGWPDLLRKAAAVSTSPWLHAEIPTSEGTEPIRVAQGQLPERPEQDPLFGIRLQLALETLAERAGGGDHRAPAQQVSHFLAGEEPQAPRASSYLPGLKACNFRKLLPQGLTQRLLVGLRQFEAQIPGYTQSGGQMIGVETRTSSPVRVLRDAEIGSAPGFENLFPCGEGAGFAGGIVSAALDGTRIARAIARQWAPSASARLAEDAREL